LSRPLTRTAVPNGLTSIGASVPFGDHDAPSTLLGGVVLGYRDQLVEVEAVAASAEHRSFGVSVADPHTNCSARPTLAPARTAA
jgi:hypothetical protein